MRALPVSAAALFAALLLPLSGTGAPLEPEGTALHAGEAAADITPPIGTELAGFHKSPGKERRVTGIRQPAFARALVLSAGNARIALVSLDVCGVSPEFSKRVSTEVAAKTGIPAENVRISATHTHSMPTLRFFRQWGGLPRDYMELVAGKAVEAVESAGKDLAPAEMRLGKERVIEGNFNRTSKEWKTDDAFTKDSTDGERWLDTTLHALQFVRERGRGDILWYQFSAHPVCYTDGEAGPDWPGLVAEKMKKRDGLSPSFLQGHCGDVNPGSGSTSLGDPEKVSEAVVVALRAAMKAARKVNVAGIRQARMEFKVPLDIGRLEQELERYRADPSKCTRGEWVDAEFARDWYESASKRDLSRTEYGAPLTALRLGDVALVFHPGELYSYYGLAIRRDSPFRDTIVVGYTDDLIGYVPDPRAYEAGEYAAVVVPKLLDLPPFKPEVARLMTAAALELLEKVHAGPPVRVLENVVVYEDSRFYAAFPSIVRRADGELLAAFRRAPERRRLGAAGVSHTDPNSYLVLVRSTDGGKTWSREPELIHAHPFGGSQDPCMVQLRDGTILCSSYAWAMVAPEGMAKLEKPVAREGSFVFLGGYLMRSRDGGRSWQGPLVPPPCQGEANHDIFGNPVPAANRGAMCEGSDGKLYWVVASSNAASPQVTATHLLVSEDKGETWRYSSQVARDPKVAFNEASLYETPKGGLVAFLRTENFGDHTCIARSTDGGKSFEWRDAGFRGHPHHALRLPDNRVLLVYGYRHPPFGIRARVLDPECTDAAAAPEIVLRDDGGNGDLGYPWATMVSCDRALVVYYFQRSDGTRHIAGTFLQIE